MQDNKLPSDEQVKKRLGELLNAKDYKTAAQLIVYHSFCKIGPDEFAASLLRKIEEFRRERKSAGKPSGAGS